MISIRKCTCCGREFATGVFGSRCERCQDEGHYNKDGFVGKRHKPCRDIMEIIHDPKERRYRHDIYLIRMVKPLDFDPTAETGNAGDETSNERKLK